MIVFVSATASMSDDIALADWSTLLRLFVAVILGGVIGIERELRRKQAGMRTNMFICLGAALFTVLSEQMASKWGGDHTRIAAQIIPGIGFIGAGSILHARGSVTGLTTAATAFVVASVGMAVGGGFYLTALSATGLVLLVLSGLGKLESHFETKSQACTYEVTGQDPAHVLSELNRIVDEREKSLRRIRVATSENLTRAVFVVEGNPAEQKEFCLMLHQSGVFSTVSSLANQDDE
jgi:putative Mg2+ transporter-C (MgtC) family protein